MSSSGQPGISHDPTSLPVSPDLSAAVPAEDRRLSSRLETVVLVHLGILALFTSWAYGGNAAWSRLALCLWASLGALLSSWIAIRHFFRDRRSVRMLLWLVPLSLLDAYVVLSCFNPNHREVFDGAAAFYVRDPSLPRWPALPSSARPDEALKALWLFNGAYLSAFNLVLVASRRRRVRTLLAVLAANALVLAVFGTVQKLMGFKAPFFAAEKMRQQYFFGSFLYHNHWGAFTLLMLCIVLGLAFHHLRNHRTRDLWHSPALAWAVTAVFLGATIPLSGSRSSTLLLLLLAAIAFSAWWRHLRRAAPRPSHWLLHPVFWTVAAGLAGAAFIYDVSAPMVEKRLALTKEQLRHMQQQGEYLPRGTLYRDTWTLARERPWLGWGMSSFQTAFYFYNTQLETPDGFKRVYRDAHSDWLQSVAEIGVVGTSLLLACAGVPLARSWRALRRAGPLVRFLFAGCGVAVLYSAFEFPFENGAVVVSFWICFFAAIAHARLDDRSARTC